MDEPAHERFCYSIDANDLIASVDDAWLEFARANDAAELTREAVVGRPLWDFIAGRETQHLYRMVLERVRADAVSVVLPFRCDTPEVRHFMCLRISPAEGGEVQLEGELFRSERRKRVAPFDPDEPRTGDFLEVCSWCKQVQVAGADWVAVEEAIARMDLFAAPRSPQLSHGMCQTCEVGIWSELGKKKGDA